MPEGQPPAQIPPLHEGALAPDDVARRSFSTTFRGFDQHEVRGFLARVAAEVRILLDRERELRRRLDAAEHQRPAPAPAPEPDEQQLIAALGTEAARVIQAAREAAVEIRTKAEEHVGRLVREAQDEAARVRTEAEQLLETRTAEAEQAAEAIRADATHEADAELERARARGREMVAEAQAVRERLLRDLARRRRIAHAQIEQLRAGRDRLLEAYRVVRQTLEETTAELTRSEPEARAAAESAALRAAGEAETTVEELEAELALARGNDLGPAFEPAAPPERPPRAEGLPVEAVPAADEPAAPGVEAAAEAATAPAAASPGDPPTAEPATPPAAAEAHPPRTTEPAAPRPPAPSGEPAPPAAANGAAASPVSGTEGPPSSRTDEPGEERRSSLRLLRRRRAEQARSEGDIDVVRPPDEVEGVRVLRPSARETPGDETAGDETPAEEGPGDEAPAVGHAGPAATEEGAAPDAPAAASEAAAAADGATTLGDGEAGGIDDDRRPASVEELFARIRAERAESVAQAEEVLALTEPDADADAGAVEAGREIDGPAPATASDGEVVATEGEEADAGGDDGDGVGPDEALLEQRDAAIEPLERQATRALKRVLADEQNAVLDRLRRQSGSPGVEELLGTGDEHAERYATAVRAALGDAARAGAAFAGDEAAGGGVDVEDLATTGLADMAGGLRDRVGSLVADAGDSGEQGLTMRLSSVYREMKTQRAEALVRDAVVAAYNRGIFAAVPDGARVRWVVDFDGKPCPDGDDNALAGTIAKGDAFPTGQCVPPAHGGCRCVLVPDTL